MSENDFRNFARPASRNEVTWFKWIITIKFAFLVAGQLAQGPGHAALGLVAGRVTGADLRW